MKEMLKEYLKKTEPEYYPPVENLLDLIYEHYTENNPVEKNTVAGKEAKEKEKELEEWLRGLDGIGRMGGGALSGKDPTKVDRSAAYMARKIAKDIVQAGYTDKCEVQLAYAIGVVQPVGLPDEDYNKVSAYGHFGKAGLPWEV